MSAISTRTPYQGLAQIVQFNWRSYGGAVLAACVAVLALPWLPSAGRVAILVLTMPAIFWMFASLAVSHYVYDRSSLYDLSWIARLLPRAPRKWINIHCGFDETSDLLAGIFPEAARQVVDIYDPQAMTEASIQLARRLKPAASVPVRYDALGFSAESFDTAFSIFAAHELRSHPQRVTLFREIARVLVPSGDFLVMEHSRDLWNFAAFGPGFLHFFSRRAWRKAAREAGFELRGEFSMTPFVRVYYLRKAA